MQNTLGQLSPQTPLTPARADRTAWVSAAAGFVFIFLTLALAVPAHAESINWLSAMKQMYDRYPSSRMLTDPNRLEATLKRVNPEAALALRQFMLQQPQAYDAAREAALKQLPVRKPSLGHVIISGASGAGTTLAKVYAEAGYEVDLYESRAVPTREVQWGARQELFGAVRHFYGANASEIFASRVASRIGDAYRHLEDGQKPELYPLSSPNKPSSAALAGKMTGTNIVSSGSVAAVRVADLEELLRHECEIDPRIHTHLGVATPQLMQLPNGSYSIEGMSEAPKFIVVAEGAGSKTAKTIGIERTEMSPVRLQVAGVILADIPGGNTVGSTFHFPGSDYTIVTGSLHRASSGKIWLVTDLDPKFATPDSSFVHGTEEFATEQKRLVENQYRKIAAKVLGFDNTKMANLKVTGATGGALAPFNMQLGLSRTALKGNVILVGDTVGNGHWSAGAGGMISMTAHPDRVANYLNDLELGVSPALAQRELNKRLIEDSRTWIRAAVDKMYPDVPHDTVVSAFDRSLAESPSPGENFLSLMEKEIAKHSAHAAQKGSTAFATDTAKSPDPTKGVGTIRGIINRCIDIFSPGAAATH